MTPADFAALHPRLFHLLPAEAWTSFQRHGLLAPHMAAAMTSPLNSGAPFAMKPTPRGDGTFLPLAAGPRADGRPVVEVVVPHAIPGAAAALLEARPAGPAEDRKTSR